MSTDNSSTKYVEHPSDNQVASSMKPLHMNNTLQRHQPLTPLIQVPPLQSKSGMHRTQDINQSTPWTMTTNSQKENHFQINIPSLPPLVTTKPGNLTQSVGTGTPNRSHFHLISSPQQPYEKNGVIQVLRYGETIASFFQINENSTEEYRNLCTTIDSVQSSLEQKASAWSRLLEIRCTTTSQNGTVESGMDLVRLHRRATSYFSSILSSSLHNNNNNNDDSKVVLSHLLRRDILQIWLSYATVQARYCHDHKDAARMTIRHIQNQSYLMNGATVPRDAAFYITWSMVEETIDDRYACAESILRTGIQHRAEPIMDLHDALRKLQQQQKQQNIPITTATTTSPKRQRELISNTSPSSKRIRIPVDNNHPMTTNAEGNTLAISDCAPSQDSNMSFDTETENAPTTETGHEGNMENDPQKFTSIEPTNSVQFQLKGPIIASSTTTTATSTTKHMEEKSVFDIPVLRHRSKATEPSIRATTTTVGDVVNVNNNVEKLPNDVTKSSGETQQRVSTINTLSSGRAAEKAVVPTTSVKSSLKANLLLSSNQKPRSKLSSSFKRPPLQFKTFGLGKAERIDPSQSILESDSDDDEMKNDHNPKINHPHDSQLPAAAVNESLHKTPIKKPKISKIDLDYMWNWDPEKRLTTTTSPATSNSIVDDNNAKAQRVPPHNRLAAAASSVQGNGISQGTPSASLSSSSSNSTATTSSSRSTLPPPLPTTTSGNHNSVRQTPDARTSSNGDVVVATSNEIHLSTTSSHDAVKHTVTMNQNEMIAAHEASNILSKVNSEFLPLIQESNVIRVNQEPYVKLGVIGKGGSCKVYRALSKDCAVLAIKRVKTDDLDRKAIDGYANEIALLKRLRGNPAIIQLHDSEVDMTRQVILLVMEAGEADLNHVLQRQSIGQGNGQERSLNMNFIRLTWQQMLKAVHSIHEQRIIHGDLKPANFLFVRGSLKLIDFGIAKAIQNDNTNNIYRENQIGTLNYMSPEAICDSGTSSLGQRMKCGRPSDIWSLGCILYQMVYGKTPFADLQMIPKLQAIVNPAHKISYPPTIDEAAIDAIRCCLHRDPKDRAPIVGNNGLLNEHRFLNSRRNDT